MMQISHIREWRPQNLTGENPVEPERTSTQRNMTLAALKKEPKYGIWYTTRIFATTDIKVAVYIANSWALLIDRTGIKKSKVNFIAFMSLHCLYVVIIMMHWYECIYSNCHVHAVKIPWKQWSLLQKSFSSLFDNQEYSRISYIHWYLDDNWYPE